MIHIATVHHQSADWIEIQRRYLDRFMSEPFRVYASLEGIAEEYHKYFDVVVPSKGWHPGKLNLLGTVILREADPDDLIVFLDGDAFPIADPIQPLRQLLDSSALAAVCRTENDGDRQPHPLFCGVSAKVWRELPGDWSVGWCFRMNRSDVGANLLYLLESTGTPWARILRSNRYDLHPVFFGIYGGFVYHHGAAFRQLKATVADLTRLPPRDRKDGVKNFLGATFRRAKRDPVARWPPRTEQAKADLLNKASAENRELSSEVFAQIKSDPDFYRQFL